MSTYVDLEICLDTIAEIEMVNGLPIKRVELCAALEVGGITPSLGFIQEATILCNKEIHVMIRPRVGGFVYTEHEKHMMLQTTKWVCEKDTAGIVFGALEETGTVDIDFCKEMVDMAQNYDKEVTFHRAIDFSKDPLHTLQTCIDLGFTRVLTSGAQDKAMDGISLIRDMVFASDGNIQIMAGSGVNSENALNLAKSGINALHFSSSQKDPQVLAGMGTATIPYPDKAWAIIDTLRENNFIP